MSFEIKKWDGFGKIGKYSIGEKSFETPALFPVVHPALQSVEPKRLKEEFGFDQLITSAYLLQKMLEKGKSVENIHSHLNFDGVIMMDSGAYQLMVYGDVELDQEKSMKLQASVGADIGVILDHPIGYDVPKKEAEMRIETTLERVKEAMEIIAKNEMVHVLWTLPIQGGKFIDLMNIYMEKAVTPETLKMFHFFALGSVVQVMINQDYPTMVRMILTARKHLPVTYPLHLFGAGHPAMFALATFLGCDTYDSAAYSLMAKDGRYMTVHGTYQLNDLTLLPCKCRVCSVHSLADIKKMDQEQQSKLISEHNLWVSTEEIARIKFAIEAGTLWELVWERAYSVPNLGRATKLAIKMIYEDDVLRSKFIAGTPLSKSNALRTYFDHDLARPEIFRLRRMMDLFINQLENKREIVVLFMDPYRSIFQRVPDYLLKDYSLDQQQKILVFIPFAGLVPFGMTELYPFSQYVTELELEECNYPLLESQLQRMKEIGITKVDLIHDNFWDEAYLKNLFEGFEIKTRQGEKFFSLLKEILEP